MIDGAGLFLDNYYIGKLMMMKYPTNNENTLVQKTKKVINVCKKTCLKFMTTFNFIPTFVYESYSHEIQFQENHNYM